jgi:hypothetical protein
VTELTRRPVDILLGWQKEEQARKPIYSAEPVTIEGYLREFVAAAKAMTRTGRINRAIAEAEYATVIRDDQRMRWALSELVHLVRGDVS